MFSIHVTTKNRLTKTILDRRLASMQVYL